MQFKPFEPGIEVYGSSLEAIVEAFKLFPSIALKRMASHGIGTITPKGDVKIDTEAWYPQADWLAVFEGFATTVGTRALFQIGQHVPKHAVFPPTVNDIHSGIASLDIAYHMNHRKGGKVMFDPTTGQKTKGIGQYGYHAEKGERRITSVCENPYPCDFDRGILSALAARFERASRVSHDDRLPCRKTGANSCTYQIVW
jgi:hypothetical protein